MNGHSIEKEKIMADKATGKKAYSKPEVRQIKLSLAELTLGTNCDINNPASAANLCPPATAQCNA
jgi:hypothetical protein